MDLELSRRNGKSAEEVVGLVPLPREYTPAEVAPVWLYLAGPPLFIFDVGCIAVGIVYAVVTTPFWFVYFCFTGIQ